MTEIINTEGMVFNRVFAINGISFVASEQSAEFFKELCAIKRCEEVVMPEVDQVKHLFAVFRTLQECTIIVRVFDKVDLEPLCKTLSGLCGQVVKVSTDYYGGRPKYLAQYANSCLVGVKLRMSDLWNNVSDKDEYHYRF